MCINPFVQELDGILQQSDDGGLVRFFADDGTIGTSFSNMQTIIEHVVTAGPQYGYYLKKSKGAYLMGKTGDPGLARERKAALIAMGLNPSIIHIHPEDLPQSTPDSYGAKILGSYIGSDEYISAQLTEHLKELTAEARAISTIRNPQIKNLLLRWCFCQKITHLQRSIQPDLMQPLVEEFTALKKQLLSSLLNMPTASIPDRVWNQAQLSIQNGGGGARPLQPP
jgi:hypothetical protein